MKKIIKINNNEIEVSCEETEIYGLECLPQFVSEDNDADWTWFTKLCPVEVSEQNFNLVYGICKKYMTHGIMEIGVSRNGNGSFTHAILQNKPDNIKYLGVDIEDKSFLNSVDKNIYTVKCSSFEHDKVRERMSELDMDKISILFIDGLHSLNAVINDWKYCDLLSDDGIVIFHDTNYHPGPSAFIEFIDDKKFKTEKYFEGQDDYGLSIAYKIKK